MADEHIFLPVAEAYDRWSRMYDAYDNPMVFGASQAVEALAPGVAGKAVVELGCGTGRNLALFRQHGARELTGCDLSSGMLEQARQRDPGLILLQLDLAQPLPLESGSADLVLFSLALEHVRDLTPALREAARLLRPGGMIAVIEIHPFLSLGNVSAHFRDGADIVRMPTFPHTFAGYINAAAEAGLAMASCREWRPRDFQGETPAKVFKRGADIPLIVEFRLSRTGPGPS
jgi:malonyl-CoA O-methyltransferase